MSKQKICIIGGSLTGLVTAISLSKYNCNIDIITDKPNQCKKSSATIAISQDNFEFLKRLEIFKNKNIWPCTSMKLYIEKNKKFSKIFEYNNKKVLYMFENYKIKNLMFNKAKKIKSIKIKSGEKVLKVSDNGMLKNVKLKKYTEDYNLVILCTGSNSSLVKNIFCDKLIKNSYKENSITAVLNHSSIKNNIARQIFLDDEILALLPISNTKTSIVWSVKKYNKKSNKILKKQIKFYANNFLKNIKFESEIEFKNLNFLIRSNYYKNRVLLFGDALHVVHPFVGQGFNMTLRDLVTLEKILEKKIKLGLDIGSSDILSEFSKETKSGNFLFSLGIDLLKNSFSIKNNYFKKIRNELFIKVNNNILAKDLFFNIADKGLKF